LIADASGNLFGTTERGGANTCSSAATNFGCGTVFEITGSSFVPRLLFAGTPRQAKLSRQERLSAGPGNTAG
jgi:hypothetical protein